MPNNNSIARGRRAPKGVMRRLIRMVFEFYPKLLPLALLRPISGSGASAYTLDLLRQFGPDSETGKIASVLSSSTETTFYAVAVYFGACGYKKLRHTLPASLMGDGAALVFSIFAVKFLG